MACRSMLRTAILAEQWLPLHFNLTSRKRGSIFTPVISSFHNKIQSHNPKFGRKIALNSKVVYHRSSSINDDSEQGPAQEAVLKAISEVSKVEGRVGQTTNVVIGGTVADNSTNEWLALDQKVNSYPTVRGFTAIGTGGNDFVQAMVVAVESVIEQSIPEGQVKQKISSGGKYVSVNIGPVEVVSSEQVQAVYNAMRRDDRMKYFL